MQSWSIHSRCFAAFLCQRCRSAAMLTYSAEELYALNVDRPPPRQVRKTLFTFRLWRPAWHRPAEATSIQSTAASIS